MVDLIIHHKHPEVQHHTIPNDQKKPNAMNPKDDLHNYEDHRNLKDKKITQYPICEGLDAVGKATLLVNFEISSFVKPPDTVRLWVWRSW